MNTFKKIFWENFAKEVDVRKQESRFLENAFLVFVILTFLILIFLPR